MNEISNSLQILLPRKAQVGSILSHRFCHEFWHVVVKSRPSNRELVDPKICHVAREEKTQTQIIRQIFYIKM